MLGKKALEIDCGATFDTAEDEIGLARIGMKEREAPKFGNQAVAFGLEEFDTLTKKR